MAISEATSSTIDANDERASAAMVAVQRADTGEWAIPGGMVEAGQVVSAQVKKEFEEECFAGDSKEHGEENRKRLEWIFHRGVEVYRGYVDDP